MIASHQCCRFVGCTSMMWISRSTTSQRCSIGLRSGDCGGHLSKVNSMSWFTKPVWDDFSFVTWCIILLEVFIRRRVHCSHKGKDMVSNNTQVGWVVFKRCSISTKGPKVCQENIPHTITPHHQPEPLRQGRMDPCFHVLYTKFWLYHLNAAEIKSQKIRQRFSNLLLSNFGDFVWIVASVSCS